MIARLVLFLFVTFVITAGVGTVTAQPNVSPRLAARVALIIGNANYPDSGAPLKEPINDANDMGEELRREGFDVDVQKNLSKDAMQRALDRFYAKIGQGSVAILFFSGYGIQSNRQTYLISVNAQIWTEPDVRQDGISLDSVLAEMNARGASIKIAILDASRRNPFERRFRFSGGLAPVVAPRGSLVIYSAEPNRTVSDPTSDHGIFVSELIKQMRVPGLAIQEVFNRAQTGVNRASQGEQLPSISTSLTDDFSFTPAPSSQRQPPPTIVSIAPTSGSSAGGTSVTITGTNFSAATGVTFAGVPAERFTVDNATSITAVTAAHAAGAVDVVVATPGGAATAGAVFTYVEPPSPLPLQAKPTIAGVAPASGDTAGGTRVTITGTNFAGVSSVTFGGAVASAYSVNSSTSITATTPAHAAGTVDVAANTSRGTTVAKSVFTYAPAAPPRRLCGNSPELSELNTRLQQNPDDVGALYKRGQLCAKNNDLMAAINDFDKVLLRNPKDADALNNSCWVRALTGDLDTALKQCDESLQIRPDNVDALDSRGLVKLKLSLYTAAINDYDAALKLNPKQASSLYGRGIAKLRSGSSSAGNSDIAAAKTISPGIADEFGGYGIRR
jgi:Caspase domain/IPT/TIG domain/Tetratricopeptide repeat